MAKLNLKSMKKSTKDHIITFAMVIVVYIIVQTLSLIHILKIDTLEEPPMFKVTDTHYAKTWLLHPDAPKVEKPEGIQNIHEKLVKAFNI